MDVIRFTNPTARTLMQQGQLINGIKSKMWVERYAAAGEFKFTCPATIQMRDLLPIGSFVSHVDTSEIMVVENHEISEGKGSAPDLIVTGRGFETEFEQRIVGSNKAFPTSGAASEYALAADLTWNQAVTLIQNHIQAAHLVDPNDAIPYVNVSASVAGAGTAADISVKRGDLYSALQELLSVDKLGIKVIRPGVWPLTPVAVANTTIVIHRGVDRSAQIVFSSDTGEIESTDYLWSNKKNKNAAMIFSRWVETRVVGAEAEIDRRWMLVDASDLDNQLSAAPVGAALDDLIAAMQQKGIAALAARNDVALTKAEVSKTANKATYRRDFDVGDIITVSGDFNVSAPMQISEYVEIEDENGRSGYPTLTLL